MAGIYVHIPFCSSFCIYCGFYSVVCGRGAAAQRTAEQYADALLREADSERDFFSGKGLKPETLYIGGGTPSLMPLPQLSRIVNGIKETFDAEDFAEFTIEANPDDITPEILAGWKKLGVNRLSMGVQSFSDKHLKWMRRRHTAQQAREAFAAAREAGFDNISIDLIFGYESLSDKEWDNSISEALKLSPEHISCYQMSIEEESSLAELVAAEKYHEPSQETCSAQYAHLCRRLAEAGYNHYEISNFALPCREARHNSSYWSREPYLGLGAAAHSFDGDSRRFWNDADVDRYIADFTSVRGGETLSETDRSNEKVMLPLRTAAGLDVSTLPEEHLAKITPAINRLMASGSLAATKKGFRIPETQFFVSDSILSELFV